MIATCLPTTVAPTFANLLRVKCEEFQKVVETTTNVEANSVFELEEQQQLPNRLQDTSQRLLGSVFKCPVACIGNALEASFPNRHVYVTQMATVDDFVCGSDINCSKLTMGDDGTNNIGVGPKDFNQSSWLKFYILDCHVNQSLRPVGVGKKKDNSVKSDNLAPVPKKVVYHSRSPSSICVDDTRCIVIAVPDAGCFYSSHEKLRASLG